MIDLQKILIVDDEPSVVGVIAEFLKWRGYKTLTALNGEDAVLLNETQNPDLIILDLRMPDINGLETLRKIRVKDADVKVIVLSGFIDDKVKEEGAALGISMYLDKPFTSEVLYEALKKIWG